MTSPCKELTMQFNLQHDNTFVLPKYQHTSSRNSCTFVGEFPSVFCELAKNQFFEKKMIRSMKYNQALQRNYTVRYERIVDEDHQLLFQPSPLCGSNLAPGP